VRPIAKRFPSIEALRGAVAQANMDALACGHALVAAAGPSQAVRQVKDWKELQQRRHPALVGDLLLCLSLDAAGKAGMSGGPLSMALPDGRADAELTHTDGTFVEYLRFVILERGGLPGLAPDHSESASRLLAELTAGLERF
jgi:hypothetical protein